MAAAASAKLAAIEKQVAEAVSNFKCSKQNISKLAADIASSEAMRNLNLDEHGLNSVLYNVFSHASNAARHDGEVAQLFPGQVTIDHVVDAATKISEKAEKMKTDVPSKWAVDWRNAQAASAGSINATSKAMPGAWEKLATQDKVGVGVHGIFATLCVFSAVSAARSSLVHDENGKTQVQWSQVGIALLETAVAVLFTYSAHKSLRGESISL